MAGVLHICTANLIRSPVAEALTRMRLPGYPIGSAGLRARDGQPLWGEAAQELARRGVPVPLFGSFRSRSLTPDLASRADLVLTATRGHRDAVIAASPTMLGRVFTWRELAWLASDVPLGALEGSTIPERISNLCALVAARRGHLAAPPGAQLDIVDPVGGSGRDLLEAVEQIDRALDVIIPRLAAFGVPTPADVPEIRADTRHPQHQVPALPSGQQDPTPHLLAGA